MITLGSLILQTQAFRSVRPFYLKHLKSIARASQLRAYNTPQEIVPFQKTYDRSIFCNVELNGASLEAIGFDMDYTLAQYNERFDLLAFEGAKQKLVNKLGYPSEVLNFKYSADDFRRGLIIDKKRGNILKTDRHRYVRKAYHGFEELTSELKKSIYSKQVSSFTESSYAIIDTIFLLVDAVLFTHLVDFRDKNPQLISKSYEQMYTDVRHSVDLCHKDGFIKDTVMKNPENYILYDEGTVRMLKQLKNSGKKIFLLTNSMWEYTNVVMDYLVHGKGDNQDIHWQDLFELIIVGACKPEFLRQDHLAIFQVNNQGYLKNVEDKDNLKQLVARDGKVFQGGQWRDLHRLLDVTSGNHILYVGDHMYADILRSKRTLGWRTCLIIPELENELSVLQHETNLAKEIQDLREKQIDLDETIDILRLQMTIPQHNEEKFQQIVAQVQDCEQQSLQLKHDIAQKTEEYNKKFNKYWGQMFKAGHQHSRFAKQVIDYACLYTSRASNLGFISANRSFRPIQDVMPHDTQAMLDVGDGEENTQVHVE